MKKLLCLGICIVTLFSLVACGGGSDTPVTPPSNDTSDSPSSSGGSDNQPTAEEVENLEELEGTFMMWNWDIPNNTNINAEFNKIYPKIQVEMLALQPQELYERYQMAIASGTEVGDIVWAERSTHAAMLRVGGFEILDRAPYNIDRNMWLDSVIPFVVDADDNVIGFDISVCPAGLGYNLDLALEYLGTNDRAELEAMFPTWDSMIEKGQEVYDASGGQYTIFANRDTVMAPMQGQWTNYAVVDGELNLEKTIFPMFEKMIKIRDNNAAGLLDSWTPEFFASMNEDNFIFIYLSSWAVEVILQSNAPDMQGKFGFMRTPEGDTSWGGTTMMIPSAAENKALAFAYLSLLYGTREGADIIKDVSVQLVGLREAFADPTFTSDTTPWFPGIDLGAILYGEIAPNMTALFPNLDNQILVNAVMGPVIGEIIPYDLSFDEAKDRAFEIIAEQNFDFLN